MEQFFCKKIRVLGVYLTCAFNLFAMENDPDRDESMGQPSSIQSIQQHKSIAPVYQLGKIKNKHLILDILSFTGYSSRVKDVLWNSNKNMRNLLMNNLEIAQTTLKDSRLKCFPQGFDCEIKKIFPALLNDYNFYYKKSRGKTIFLGVTDVYTFWIESAKNQSEKPIKLFSIHGLRNAVLPSCEILTHVTPNRSLGRLGLRQKKVENVGFEYARIKIKHTTRPPDLNVWKNECKAGNPNHDKFGEDFRYFYRIIDYIINDCIVGMVKTICQDHGQLINDDNDLSKVFPFALKAFAQNFSDVRDSSLLLKNKFDYILEFLNEDTKSFLNKDTKSSEPFFILNKDTKSSKPFLLLLLQLKKAFFPLTDFVEPYSCEGFTKNWCEKEESITK